MPNKQEERLDIRVKAEDIIKEYYEKCLECDYDFKDDLKDIVWDATNGNVDITA